MVKVHIILVNYNEYHSTIECINSLLRSSYNYYDILIVDNASPNGSYEKLDRWLSSNNSINFFYDHEYVASSRLNSVVLFKSEENNGFAAGCNIATKRVISNACDGYIWYLNNDTIVDIEAMSHFVNSAAKNGKKNIYSSTLVKYGTKNVQCLGGGFINNFFGYQKYIGEDLNLSDVLKKSSALKKEVNEKLDYVVGASMFMSVDVLIKYGLMREDFFLYWEETDFCFMVKSHGVGLLWVPESIVFHKIGKSTDIKSNMTDYYSTRNTIKFFKKWNYKMLPVIFTTNLIIKVFNKLKRGQFDRVKLVLKALIRGIKE